MYQEKLFLIRYYTFAFQEDPLYMSYAHIIAKSCGEEEEEGGGDEEEGGGEPEAEDEGRASIHVSCNYCFIWLRIRLHYKM